MAQTPTALTVSLKRPIYDSREPQIEISVYGSAYEGDGSREGLTYQIDILHHPVEQSRNPAIDAVVDSTSDYQTDSTGQITIFWTHTAVPKGLHNCYYVRATYDDVVGYSDDFLILQPDDYMIYALDLVLADLQRIPLRNEISLDNQGDIFRFTSRYWRPDMRLYFRLNNSRILELADALVSKIDYTEGVLYLTESQPAGTRMELLEGYRKFFDYEQLREYLEIVLSEINLLPPETHFSLENYPGYWQSAIIYGAQAFTLNSILTSTTLREQIVLLLGNEAIGTIQNVASAATSRFDNMKQTLKKRIRAGGFVIRSHDTAFPPRVTAANFQSYLYLRFGR